MNNIEFGTDGWRAIIGKEFTSDNVKVVAQAIADYVKHHDLDGRGVVVGYDTRKGSRDFADSVCSVMLGNNIPCYITDRDTPTPVTAFEVLDRKTGGAVMITASHNPPEWNGIKYIPEYAGPALPDVTEELTKRIADVMQTKKVNESSIEQGLETHLLSSIDPTASYIEFVRRQLDIETIQKARLRIVCDCMHGTSRGYLSRILESVGCEVTTIHDEPDPKFGGSRPEPLPEFLGDLKARVAGANAELGLATDGDADRLAAYDSDGNYFGADQLFPMLYEFIVRSGCLGGVVRTVATTHLVDRIAEKYGLPVYEVPVGFKYVGKYLREKDVAMGGEESGGLSFKGHISEKDGIMTGVKIAEMCAKTKKSLSQLMIELRSEYGSFVNGRRGVSCPNELKQVVMERLFSNIPNELAEIPVSNVINIDGLKLILENEGWILIRPSGTESLLRIYGESTDDWKLEAMLDEAENLTHSMMRM